MGPMTSCRQCGGLLSVHAQMCPHCGAPAMYARGPSGLFWAVLALVLLVFAGLVMFALSQGNVAAIK
jgi:hypothetical protein